MDLMKGLDDLIEGTKRDLGKLEDTRRDISEGRGAGQPPKRKPGRPKATASAPRARKKGTRADEAVACIAKHPGLTAPGLAKKMKMNVNYLYRVLAELEQTGRIKKDGRTYAVLEAEPAAA